MNSVNMPRIFSVIFASRRGCSKLQTKPTLGLRKQEVQAKYSQKRNMATFQRPHRGPRLKNTFFCLQAPNSMACIFPSQSACGREDRRKEGFGHPQSPLPHCYGASPLILGTFQAASFFQFLQQTFVEYLICPKPQRCKVKRNQSPQRAQSTEGVGTIKRKS